VFVAEHFLQVARDAFPDFEHPFGVVGFNLLQVLAYPGDVRSQVDGQFLPFLGPELGAGSAMPPRSRRG
jgi:hypothetical protein